MSSQEEDSTRRITRRSLQTLQHTATDIENLVGRPSKSLKHQLSQDTHKCDVTPEVKRKNLLSKETQVSIKNKITVDDLTNPHGASEKYWEILAGKRQVALQDALDENEKLRKVIEDLKEENSIIKQMLDEANSFVEVIKEELNGTNNDTGIDVNDVSTADETSTLDDTEDDKEEETTPTK